jgi:hypothetical protein
MRTENNQGIKQDWNKDGSVNHADLEFYIREKPEGEPSMQDLLAYQRDGGQLTAEDLIEFRKSGGNITASELKVFTKRGGELSADQLFTLMGNGVVITGDDMVSLSKRGVEFTAEDLKRFQSDEFHGHLSERNIKNFENRGIDVDTPNTIPENATWSDIEGMMKAGVKMSAEDIIDWGKTHPEEAGKMQWAFIKDKGIGEHNLGEVVGWLVEKGAKITKTDVFSLQEKYHCFSGTELADISSNGKIKFTAEDLIHLQTDLQCGFDNGDLEKLVALDKIKLTPDQYKTLVG